MKSSIFFAASSAMLAVAKPVDKRAYETKVVVEYSTVTVTGAPPPPPPTTVVVETTVHPTVAHTKAPPPVVVVTVTGDPKPAAPPPTTFPEYHPPATYPVQAPPPPATYPVQEPAPPAPTTTKKPVVEQEPTQVTSTHAAQASVEPAGDDFQSNALYHHNIHRANHSAPALTWDTTLAGYAANTAKTCFFAHDMTQGNGGYGQNIASWAGTNAKDLGQTGAIKMAATDMWYDGEFNKFLPSYYGKATPDMGNFEAWGHLSQLVWKDTTALGCAVQFCPAGTMYDDLDGWYSVCNYNPPGNVGGAYGKNVLAPQGAAPVAV